MENAKYIQFKVIGNNYLETFAPHEPPARRAYGRIKKTLKNKEGFVQLYARTSHDESWILLLEFQKGKNNNAQFTDNRLLKIK
jgi:hypothetical protein